MDRGIKDEAFVSRALQEADFGMGRWIANQAFFNNAATSPINEIARAAVITAVAIFNQKYGEVITEQDLMVAKNIKTVGDAMRLIDSVSARLPDRHVNK
ncbi:MAG: hypothetical protein N2557_08360 [Hydrogenophilus sp.]|nr:hypothetical protein [Hydrogenophilus sp.]